MSRASRPVQLLVAGCLLGAVAAALMLLPRLEKTASDGWEQPVDPPKPIEPSPSWRELVRITPEMVTYSGNRYALYFVGTGWGLTLLFLLLQTGLSARIRDQVEQRIRNPFLQAVVFWACLSAVMTSATLPLSYYSGFWLRHRFGLSTQNHVGWFADQLKSYGVTLALMGPLLAVVVWSMRRRSRRWWFDCWLASIPLAVSAVYLVPLLVDPLYNKFQPLEDQHLRDRILALARTAGIEHGRVLEVDASRRTRAVNAYVTGLGGSARIVLWDTLLQRLDAEEALFVMAHEMGHYSERHVPIGLSLGLAATLGMLGIFHLSGRWIVFRWGNRWGLRGPDDLAAVPIYLFLYAFLSFLGNPVECAVSRTLERRADRFALRLLPDGRVAASSFVKLAELNLSHPDPPPFIHYWMFTHPPLSERIQRALDWQPGP